MFVFNKKETTSEYDRMNSLHKAIIEANKPYFDWIETEDYKRLKHLETLIIKTYETVNIKFGDVYDDVIDETFTGSGYVEDFEIFFKPEIFNKLKEWCREYEMLLKKHYEALGRDYDR